MQDKKEVFESLSNAIYRYCRYRLKNTQDAEDCTSEVFTRWLESDNAPTDLHNLRLWIFGLARNVIREKYRELNKMTGETSDIVLETDDKSIDIENQTIDSELLGIIKQEIKNLDQEAQEILVLKIWEDLNFREISGVVDKPENTIKTIYYRSLEDIKVKLNSKGTKLRAIGLPLIVAATKLFSKRDDLQISTAAQDSLWQSAELQTKILSIKNMSMMQQIKTWVKAHKLATIVGACVFAAVVLGGLILLIQLPNRNVGTTTPSSTSSQSSSTVSTSTVSSTPSSTVTTTTEAAADLKEQIYAAWNQKDAKKIAEITDNSFTVIRPASECCFSIDKTMQYQYLSIYESKANIPMPFDFDQSNPRVIATKELLAGSYDEQYFKSNLTGETEFIVGVSPLLPGQDYHAFVIFFFHEGKLLKVMQDYSNSPLI